MKAFSFVKSMALATLVAASPVLAQDNQPAKVTVKKPALPVAKAAPVGDAPRLRPLSVTVNLAKSTQIRGALTDATSIEMKTSFGQVTLPLSEVAGIRMADESTATTTVVLHNGDSVTGATDFSRLTVETEWGVATINGSNVSNILFVPGLKWDSQSGLNGVRWSLVEANSAKPASTASSRPKASSTATTSARPVTSNRPVYSGQPSYGQPMIIRTR